MKLLYFLMIFRIGFSPKNLLKMQSQPAVRVARCRKPCAGHATPGWVLHVAIRCVLQRLITPPTMGETPRREGLTVTDTHKDEFFFLFLLIPWLPGEPRRSRRAPRQGSLCPAGSHCCSSALLTLSIKASPKVMPLTNSP